MVDRRRRVPLAAQDWRRSLHGLLAPARSVVALLHRRRPRQVLGLLVSLPMCGLSVLVWFLVARIAAYGLFWSGGEHNDAWGGPTLAGAWAVHAVIALAITLVAMALLAPLTRLHDRLIAS